MVFAKWNRMLVAAGMIVLAGTAFWGCGNNESSGGSAVPPAPSGSAATPASAVPSAYAWETPAGWTELATTPLRQANFTAGPDGQVEIYMTVLPGAGGGIAANINRWRKQMGQEEISDDTVAALPTVQVLGSEARYVDIDGTYTGMGEEKHENYRMAGALLEQNGKAVFLKMVGPADAVAAEEGAFKQFAQSLKVAEAAPMQTAAAQPDSGARELPPGHPPIEGSGASPMGAGATGLPPGHPPVEGGQEDVGLPPGHPPMGGGDNMMSGDKFHGEAEVPDLDLVNNLRWEAPEGWQRGEDQPMRLVTYKMGESGNTECYITILPGTGGGAAANINRWRRQMGQAELSNDEIGALEQVDVLGRPALLAEIHGEYTGMSGPTQSDYVMLGLVALVPGNSIFIKLIGPAAEALDQGDAFRQFCKSLRLEEPAADAAPKEPAPDAAAVPEDAPAPEEAPAPETSGAAPEEPASEA